MKIIPAIDILNGKCVRLSQGDYNTSKIYNENPLEIALQFQEVGIQYLHLVDLDGAKANQIVNAKVLETLANKTKLTIDFGGGIKSKNDLKTALNCGANQVTIGSLAVKNQELTIELIEKFGSGKIILGADSKHRKISTQGWTESSDLEVLEFIQFYQTLGIQTTIVTDIEKDGMLQGPSIDLYQEIIANSTINLIASGGITSLDDLKQLKQIGCAGAIIGKAIYEGKINLKELVKLC
jgi:phosphoribosylformimino-5-aminoimidazole carboxamide ribotide isomerase